MRKIIILSAFVLMMAIDCYAQNIDTAGLNMPFKSGGLIYEGVIKQDKVSKSELYKNAKQWFVDAFKSSKDVIQSEDKEDGKIIAKGIMPAYYKWLSRAHKVNCMITIQIECKDEKYRYKIYDMMISSDVISSVQSLPITNLNERFGKRPVLGILSSVDEQTKILISSLKESMSSKASDF